MTSSGPPTMEGLCVCATSPLSIRSQASDLGASGQVMLVAQPIVIHQSPSQLNGPEASFGFPGLQRPWCHEDINAF